MHEVLGVVKTVFCAGGSCGHLGSAEVVGRYGDRRSIAQITEARV